MAPYSDPSGPPLPDVTAARRHLGIIWPGGLPATCLISTWSKGGGGRQFLDLDDVAADLCSTPDRYLACAAFETVERGKRGNASQVRAIAGFAIDVDCRGGAHAQQQLPTNEEALELLRSAPLPPHYVLHSGGGLYGWLLFEHPFLITSGEARRRVEALSKLWHRTILDLALRHAWILDATHDLPRCLRAPGTLNGKYSPARVVRVIHPPGDERPQRIAFAELERLLPSGRNRAHVTPAAESAPAFCSSMAEWLEAAGRFLGGINKPIEQDQGLTGIVLVTCPTCGGKETGGSIARATAHVARSSGSLRCKRASCEAYEGNGGLAIETWTARHLAEADRARLLALRSRDQLARPALTDDGNALRLVRRYGSDLRWCPEIGWLHWDRRRWVPAETTALALARECARSIAEEAVFAEDDATRDAILKHCARSQGEPRIRAMLALARSDLHVRAAELDADAWRLNVANGTIDLRSGELHPHAREHLCTKIADVEFDPAATNAQLDEFLRAATRGDDEYAAHIWRLIGYTLVGEKRDDIVVLLLGPGSTGKTTLLEALLATLGDYGTAITFEALLVQQRGGSSPTPELAKLRGMRFVKAAEAPERAELNASMIKAISGGETVSARGMYQTPIEFRPQFVLWMASNFAPRINAADSGARRRLIVLPFEQVVDGDDIDTTLRHALQAPEVRSAILAHAVRGALEWQKHGLGTSAPVERATTSFWEGAAVTDLLPRFVEAECVLDPLAWSPSDELRARLGHFASRFTTACPSYRALAGFLRACNCTEKRSSKQRGWRGIRLVDHPGAPGKGDGDSSGGSGGGDDASDAMTPVEPVSLYTPHSPSLPPDHDPLSSRGSCDSRHSVIGVTDPESGKVGDQ